tara:strand:- start:10992 stop:11546 length:555 start_codon:yes stop_codon:yes gene_type:complete
MKQEREEFAIVLDFLPHGYPFDSRPMHRKTPIVQAISQHNFSLLELVPKKGVTLQPHQKVYIGEGKREEIHHVSGRLSIDKLTGTAQSELEHILEVLVKERESEFVNFFNKAGPISTRRHQIELLPGIGKKHMWEIIEERRDKPFENFEDIKNRVSLIPDPLKTVIRRIIMEMKGEDKFKIFTR